MKILPLILAAWARLAVPQDGVMPPLVVVSSMEPDIARPLVDRFRAAHPEVEVQLVELDARTALERIRGEAAAKRIASSVWWGADDLALQEAAGEGLLDSYAPGWAATVRATQRHADALWTGLYIVPIALVSKPACQDLPATYDDLADPRFRTRLLLRLPSSSEAMRRFLGVMFTSRFVDKIGVDSAFDWAAMVYVNREDDEFLDDDKILTRLADKGSPECELALLPAPAAINARDFDGLAIRITFLPAAPAYLEGIARVKGAPNSEAAARFIDFAGTAEAGREALKRGHVPIAGDPGAAPPLGLTLDLDADLGRRDLMLRELPAWLTRIEQRVRAGVAVSPEGEDPNLWIFNIIDIVGTLIIVVVLVVLFRRGKFKQLVETAAAAAPPESAGSSAGADGRDQRVKTMTGTLSHLECSACGARADAFAVATVCPRCSKPLLARYDLTRARATLTRARLQERRADLWRYREVLPVNRDGEIVSLGEGWTPLLTAPRLAARIGVPRLFVKEEGRNPTGSFKARGMAAAVSAMVRLGVKRAYVPSAGNAAGALAAYGASAGLDITIAVPRDTPEPNILECQAAGAKVHLVDGLIGDCAKFLRERFAGDAHALDVSTLREPYRVEGKKTMLYELLEQFEFDLPEVLVYPTGGGTGIVGMRKALDEFAELGFHPGRTPRFVVVQAAGCAPLVNAFEAGLAAAEPVVKAFTVASGLRVPSAIGDFLVLRALRETGGTAVAVSDEDLTREIAAATRDSGIFFSPEGAAAVVAAQRLAASGWIRPEERVVLFNTGSGLKYPEATKQAISHFH